MKIGSASLSLDELMWGGRAFDCAFECSFKRAFDLVFDPDNSCSIFGAIPAKLRMQAKSCTSDWTIWLSVNVKSGLEYALEMSPRLRLAKEVLR
jgi:hypothetical protein